MKISISIPDALFEASERLAKKLGMPRSRLYARAIERYVAQAEARDVTERLNKVYEHENSELDPLLATLQSLSLPREKW
jgi:metal-responsive CopG/Arc/MetJ family transcriptional regulator